MEMSLAFPVDLSLWFFREQNILEAKTNRGFTNPFTTGLYHKLSLAGNGAQL